MITYPVRAAGDGTERIVDAAGQVLGTVEIVAALNAAHGMGRARPHHEAEYVPGRGTWGELT